MDILKSENGDNSHSKMVWTHYGLVREGLWIEEGAQRVEDAFFFFEVVIQVNGGGINRSLLPDKATQANLAAMAKKPRKYKGFK